MQKVRTAVQRCLGSNGGRRAHIVPCKVWQSGSVCRSVSLVPDTGYETPEPDSVILGIVAMTVVPMMSSAASMQIRSAANMIAADLEYAKSMAISRGQYFSVVFDQTTESYRIEDQNGNVVPHPVQKGSNYIIDFRNDGRLNRVDIVGADFDATNEIKFDYLGSPYSGGDTPLNSGAINLQAGSATRTVTVEAVTGYISVVD